MKTDGPEGASSDEVPRPTIIFFFFFLLMNLVTAVIVEQALSVAVDEKPGRKDLQDEVITEEIAEIVQELRLNNPDRFCGSMR